MLLTDLVEKHVISGKTIRGECRGIGVSSKNYAIKYLLCAETPRRISSPCSADFSIAISSVEKIEEDIHLTRVRPVYPKSCVKLFIGQPIYSQEGVFLGNISNVQLEDFTATCLYTDRDTLYPTTSIIACSDALILRKEQPYPIGQRIPAPVVLNFSNKNTPVVTKPFLREAIQKSMLIKLTLTLPPFQCDFEELSKNKRRFF